MSGFVWFIIAILLFFLFAWIVQLLWNYVMPNVFSSVNTITFWQAVALYLLITLLFGSLFGADIFTRLGLSQYSLQSTLTGY